MIGVSQLALAAAVLSGTSALAHEPLTRARTPVRIPDIPGYLTLKCDFHIHTVFSDGLVWPTVRAEEAWREGLDAIAITDHIEYLPHKQDVSTNHNRAFDVAAPHGRALGLITIRGSEITRAMPPGHLNAIFLTNSAALAVADWRDALAEAHRQGAFIFWNHPGWSAQLQDDGLVRWYAEHTELVRQRRLHGTEVVNSRSYYPEALHWAQEHHLTPLSNSDIHNPLNLDYHVHDADHRPLTLVFARERSADAIKEALFAHRTVAYGGARLLGAREFLRPLFDASIEVLNARLSIRGKETALLQIHNRSDIPFTLERLAELKLIAFPKTLILPPQKTVLVEVRGKTTDRRETCRLSLPYRVTNALVDTRQPLEATFSLEIEFTPTPPN